MSCNLTLSDCDLILKKHLHDDIGGATTTSIGFKVKPISDNIIGYLGKHLTIEIRYKINDEDARFEKARFFLKSTTDLNNPYVNYFPNVYYKESGMYQMMEKYNADCGDLFKLDIAPRMYLDHAKSETIVMEDLSIRGFRMYDPVKKVVDAAHMLVALDVLAKLHAASIVYEETKSSELNRRFDITEEFGHYLEETAFSKNSENPYKYTMAGLTGLCALIDLLPPDNRISANEFKRQLMIAGEKMLDLMEDTKTYRCVWSHGDLWARNIMYSYDTENNPTDCKFVDFQFVRFAPPALDVTLLIYHTLDAETYENNYDRFLNHYYASLMNHLEQGGVAGDQIYSKEYFSKSCEDYLYCSKLMLGIYRSLTAASEETYWNLAKDLNTYEHVLMVDRSEFAKQNFLNDKNYAEHLTEIMESLKKMILEQLIKKIEEEHFY